MDRPEFYLFHQGEKTLPFGCGYQARLAPICAATMPGQWVEAWRFSTSMPVRVLRGFCICAFWSPLMRWSNAAADVTISAGIDAAQPWAGVSHGEQHHLYGLQRDNYWRAVLSVTGPNKVDRCEFDHLTITQRALAGPILASNES